MIIVSQDRYKVINFNNVSVIAINEHDIECETTDGIVITIGTYKTVKREKEILQEIVEAYVDSKKSKEAQAVFGYSVIPSNTYYEMPKE